MTSPLSSPADAPTSFRPDEGFARELDRSDPLGRFAEEFEIPRAADIAHPEGPAAAGDERSIYLCGNSLGCMPRRARALVQRELDDWARLGVEAHLHGQSPWLPYHEQLRGPLGRLVGAHDHEVVAMNSLTVNLHLLMISFYRPTPDRYRIVIEDSAFPSDSYAVQSQAALHARSVGFDPASAIIRLTPRVGEYHLRTEDVLRVLEEHSASIALVMLGGVNYLTGQFMDIPVITAAGRRLGCVVGWDLAHAAGNVPLRLHDWDVDWAAWCSYKYLNAGPGAVAGAFVHDRHLRDPSLPRLAGWWGNDPATRFRMGPDFVPVPRADAWALSNPPILSMAPLVASLELFDRAGMEALRRKSLTLTAYFEWWIDRLNGQNPVRTIRILTPRDSAQRGCHLSLELPGRGRDAMDALRRAGVVCDFREPNVIRMAPVPLYNSFMDVYRAAQVLARL
ncbi:MAG: Kynureninase [Phycisphaerales bacterium]|nr:Kynureninase [Phycisphaerales bacterium]